MPDNAPNYASYSVEELEDVIANIDAPAFLSATKRRMLHALKNCFHSLSGTKLFMMTK